MQAAGKLRPCGELIRKTKPLDLLPFLAPSIPRKWLPSATSSRCTLESVSSEALGKSCFSTSTQRKAPSTGLAQQAYNDDGSRYPQQTGFRGRRQRKDADGSLDRVMGNIHATKTQGFDGDISRKMLQPGSAMSSDSDPTRQKELMEELKRTTHQRYRNFRSVRARPEVGRTVELRPASGVEFGRALMILGGMVGRNRIRKDQREQKYHERRGQKRKRLKKERWRSYFKTGFDATVNRVRQMRAKGW